jgi:class 3 adenylate cyclase
LPVTERSTETVTFLFTDVEGSTRLLQALGERYGDVLAEHQRLLREAFSRYGGREIDTQGDSFFVAFASAGDAVSAGAAAQRALAEHPWPDEGSLRVRIGIHTGRATVRDDRYLGVAVHRAARIAAAGHGGQILLSETTRKLLEDEDVESLEFRDLGAQRLKDFDRPVRVYQVVGEGLERDFASLRTELRRRRKWVALGAAAGIALVAAFVVTRNSGGGDVSVLPNGVGMLDGGKLVASDTVGASPAEVATTSDSAWVTSTDGQTVAQVDLHTGHVRQTIPVGERRRRRGRRRARRLGRQLPRRQRHLDRSQGGGARPRQDSGRDGSHRAGPGRRHALGRQHGRSDAVAPRRAPGRGEKADRGGSRSASGGGRRRRRLGRRPAPERGVSRRPASPQGRRPDQHRHRTGERRRRRGLGLGREQPGRHRVPNRSRQQRRRSHDPGRGRAARARGDR